MSRSPKAAWLAALVLAVLTTCLPAQAQVSRLQGIGRTATPAELKAWDIDVRPDFKGLPPGQGSVRRGEQLWEAQCASCHGTFGESNDVFTPLVGYTSKQDMESGHVANLRLGANAPTRTSLMKVSQLSTLWDYIYRAMPWTAPKTLSPDDVYALTAYLLNLGGVLPDDFTLSDRNMREVQSRLPNRNGMTTRHGLWPGIELGGHLRPDVQGSACMRNCLPGAVGTVASALPDYARNAHGNLAEQSRALGPTRGANTLPTPAGAAASPVVAAAAGAAPAASAAAAESLRAAQLMPVLQKNVCVACHAMSDKLVGPAFQEIAAKYKGRADAETYLMAKIRQGGQGVWGAIPMPAQSIGEADARRVAQWLAQGARP
ncbi:MAG: c-type cytochrome [Rubrivivax sp.]|nr:c-type cytochrome [Burkholderiaceae bacterium]MDO9073659.1 c-type cytochrome [Rubrivivax sp.]